MADKATTVPFNFGLKYFNSKYQSNIVVLLKDGEKIKVNSVILSINSPYLEEIIENQKLKIIEMDGFDPIVCRGFLRSLYTGDLSMLDRDSFRQVSKMAHTFQVTWMKQKCLEFFNCLMTAVPNTGNDGIPTDDDRFLLEEAIAAKPFDEEKQYLNALVRWKSSNLCNNDVSCMGTVLEDLGSLPVDQLDFFICVANKCERFLPESKPRSRYCRNLKIKEIEKECSTVIVEKVTAHLLKIEKLDSRTRYVLENLDFGGITSKFKGNCYYPGRQDTYRGGFVPLDSRPIPISKIKDNFKSAATTMFQSIMNLKEISNDDMKMTLQRFMSLGN